MKFIPDAIARKVAEQGLLASQHSPSILFGAGVVGMVGSTVLACRATLKLESAIDAIEAEKAKARDVHDLVHSEAYTGEAVYPVNEMQRDLQIITVRGIGSIIKLYAPSVLLGAVSIAALTKSHNILKDRNLALTAAYAAVDTAFSRYRERVIEKYGEEADRDLRYDTEEVDVIDEETGKVTQQIVISGAPGSVYARFFDEVSSRDWSRHPETNLLFLRSQQNYANDRLRARGHVFLNEVYDMLGLDHTTAGAVVGWRWNKNSGDDVIDFGCFEGSLAHDFFNGREAAVLLDFNVDGVIYDLLEPTA